MSREIEGKLSELKTSLVGEESWELEQYQRLYNNEVNGIKVYEVKPWDVKIGDTLKLRPKEVLEVLESAEVVPGHWVAQLHDYVMENNPVITVDEEIYNEIYCNEGVIVSLPIKGKNELYWHLSLPMFTYVGERVFEEVEKEEKPSIHSIRKDTYDQSIIEEMIKKVDKKRLRNLLSISASLGEDMRYIVSKEMVDKYLRLWAEAKYEFYLLFGRELSLSKDIEIDMSEKEMQILKQGLISQFPKYGLYINEMRTSYFLNNEIDSNCLPSYSEYYGKPFFSGKGMKLSKFFSTFLQDEEFDIELSKIMQNKKVTGTIFLSIDPYDYLTSSINKHDWKSCHRITDGEWGTGSVSYMLDDTTIVSYRAKRDEVFKYDFWGLKFEGNSKLHRQLIYFDKDSCSIIFGRQYPNDNAEISKEIRTVLEDKVATYLDVDNQWKIFNERYDGEFEDIVDLHYSDVHNNFAFKFARLSGSREGVAHWKVGSKLPCLCGCGNMVDERGERAVCSDCQEELGDSDDYYEED